VDRKTQFDSKKSFLFFHEFAGDVIFNYIHHCFCDPR
jgi:hypothetical protein